MKLTHTFTTALALIFFAGQFSSPILAAEPLSAQELSAEQKGLAIATKAYEIDKGWGDSSSTMQMILRKKKGQERTREMRSRSIEIDGDGDRGIIIFDDPADVKGTAMLTHSHKVESDDQWLFLPDLKRVKRISSSNKSGAFMSSEFAYEDMGSQEVEKYTYRFIRDENIDGRDYFVIERKPVDRKSGYTKQITWIDQETYRMHRVEFYDRKSALLKTLNASEYKLYLDKYWRPGRMDMQNHITGKSTTLLFKDYQFANGFEEKDFTKTSLKKAK
ncbi:MAG: outer membrane lipoprotein-sorting protein [Gammaproteobacteria bacterium]|nr:outer membrane lipoprotein-sorting protein [Gammaproteobacteria bacterium]NNM14721.1 outer membrane lipoprotein-sorting protein [Gammaproteobacteria bacterium]